MDVRVAIVDYDCSCTRLEFICDGDIRSCLYDETHTVNLGSEGFHLSDFLASEAREAFIARHDRYSHCFLTMRLQMRMHMDG